MPIHEAGTGWPAGKALHNAFASFWGGYRTPALALAARAF